MKNQYWLITPPGQSKENFNQSILRGRKQGRPHQLVHWNWNNDQTKVIIQAEFSDEDIAWLQAKPWATYLGDYVDGSAEQKVHDYLAANSSQWGADEQ